MRIILWEWKKLFRPIPILLCLGVFILLSLDVPEKYLHGKQLLDTKNYPESFTIYDDYSIDILFHDFLLENYGTPIGSEHLENLTQLRNTLLDQVDVAAQNDEVLIRTNTLFKREGLYFYSTSPGSSAEYPENDISEEDQIYIWSCVNGQMKLAGTDYPVGFLPRLDTVIAALQTGDLYHVLSSDLVYPVMSYNIDLLQSFIFSTWVLVIIYGVSEAKSRTELLAFSTKNGRKMYPQKFFATSAACFLIIVAGMLCTASLFKSMGVIPYWDSLLDSLFLPDMFGNYKLGLTISHIINFGQLYWLLLGMTALMGFAGSIIITHLSLICVQAVSAIAYSIPVLLAFNIWTTANARALNSSYFRASLVVQCVFAGLLFLAACLFSIVISRWKYKKEY